MTTNPAARTARTDRSRIPARDAYVAARKATVLLVVADIPVFVWGPPGTGKSVTAKAIAKTVIRGGYERVFANIRQPEDFGGLPRDTPEGFALDPPNWARRLAKQTDGVLFLDELSTAGPQTQNACYAVVLDRVVGDLELPSGVRVLAAGNPADVGSGICNMTVPLANRFAHILWEPDPQSVVDGFTLGWPEPDLYAVDTEKAAAETVETLRAVGAFLSSNYDLVSKVPAAVGVEPAEYAYPTARSWEYVARLLGTARAAVDAHGEPVEWSVLGTAVRALVGPGAGSTFLEFYRHSNVPPAEDVIKDPAVADFPGRRADVAYYIGAGVLAALRNNPTPARWKAVGLVLGVMADTYADVATGLARLWADPDGGYRPQNAVADPTGLRKIAPILGLVDRDFGGGRR